MSNSVHVKKVNVDAIMENLPPQQRWIDHLKEDLLPFWTFEDALGVPAGNFPTYRNNDGTTACKENPSSEFKKCLEDPDLRGLVKLNRQYCRAQSRQSYAYGIAFHMTGDEKYLKLCKAGVDYMRETFIDKSGKGVFTYKKLDTGENAPKALQRTSQDMAYALTGIGFYYYLTHDEEVLPDIINIKEYIFNTYYDKDLGLFKWLIEESEEDGSPKQKELVAQLDQIYAYMLWLTPSLPEPYQSEWKDDLCKIAKIMIMQFFSEEYQFFWGTVTDCNTRKIGAPHTDFGHSIKTLWLIYQIGKINGDINMVNFSRDKASRIINTAYIEETGSWARRFDEEGNLDYDKEWWILAELDQTAATLGLIDSSFLEYLPQTYDYWFKYMVDHRKRTDNSKIGGIWHMVDGKTNSPKEEYPKQHSWKNSLHTFEHALVGYLTTGQIKGINSKLYFAFKNQEDCVKYMHPYFYLGKLTLKTVHYDGIFKKYEVEVTDLR